MPLSLFTSIRTNKWAFSCHWNVKRKRTSDSHKAFIESITGPLAELNYKSNLSWYVNPFDVDLVKILHILWC